MNIILYNYTCGSCGFTFKLPELTEAYGEFIMRSSKTNESVYLNAFKDKIFDEIADLFKDNEIVKRTNRLNDSDLFQSIYSVSCDLASDGGQYQIAPLPMCPNCGSRNMASWGQTYPPEYSEGIEPVTHACWNKLTDKEKRDLLNEAIKTYLYQNDRLKE